MAKKKIVQAPKKRKVPQAVYTNARAFVLATIGGEDGLDRIIHKVFLQALKGSFKHQELLLNYILGKPVEKVKLEQHGAPASSPAVVKIIADHLRLDRLQADVDAAPIVSADRIKEMENILNKEI